MERIVDISHQLSWLRKPGRINRACFRLLERILGFDAINRVFGAALENARSDTYNARMLEELDIEVMATGAGESAFPKEGPLIVVSNHPFGGADSIALAALTLRVRPDSKVLANEFLSTIEMLKPHLITVDVFGGTEATRRNRAAMREVKSHLDSGGTLSVFPSGEVSSWSWKENRVVDPPWSNMMDRLARKTGATVIPIFIPGRNSMLFHALGMIHPFLRTAWLTRELLRHRGTPIELVIGDPVEADRIEGDLRSLVEQVRIDSGH